MKISTILSIKNEIKLFNNNLQKKIKSKFNSLYNDDCYLIKDTWFNDLNNFLNGTNINNKNNINNFLKEKEPEFLNDISSTLNYLNNNNNKIKLLKQNFMKLLYNEDYLNKNNLVKYYTGNNKIIIEFKEKDEFKCLLITNPLNYPNNNVKIYILTINNNKKKKNIFFGKILSLDIKINLKDYFKNLSNEDKDIIINIEEFNDIIKNEIIKIFIYFFYYEILLPLEQKEHIFNEKERYYLINPKWIDQYKKYYNYEKIRTLLNNINNDNINYYNSDEFTNKLIKTVKDEINFNKLKLPEDLLNKDKIEPPTIIKEKIKYYKPPNFTDLFPFI